MSAEPNIPHQQILEALNTAYGLDLERLSFLGLGTAHSYCAEADGERYFLKLVQSIETFYGAEMHKRIQAESGLLDALAPLVSHIPQLLHTKTGDSIAWLGKHPMLLYQWIDAENLGSTWQDSLPEVAQVLGKVHRTTLQVQHINLPVAPEDFGLPFAEQLHQNLAWLKNKPSRDGVKQLSQLLAPHQAALFDLLRRIETFQAAARALDLPFVLCHTDAHGGNLMRDAQQNLWLIDWEMARLAPAEHDLWMLHRNLPQAVAAYRRAFGGEFKLHFAVMAFYVCRRVLEDMAVDINMMLHENSRPEEDASNLEILENHVLPDLARVETRLLQIERDLDLV